MSCTYRKNCLKVINVLEKPKLVILRDIRICISGTENNLEGSCSYLNPCWAGMDFFMCVCVLLLGFFVVVFFFFFFFFLFCFFLNSAMT